MASAIQRDIFLQDKLFFYFRDDRLARPLSLSLSFSYVQQQLEEEEYEVLVRQCLQVQFVWSS